MKIYLASNNPNKVKEILKLVSEAKIRDVELHAADILGGMPEVEETEPDYKGNALLKARALLKKAPQGAWVIADDSGLEVEALDNRPGVRSARYAGEPASAENNNALLLKELEGVEASKRMAAMHTTWVVMNTQGKTHVFDGICKGSIISELRGDTGFGYDPLFIPLDYDKTFAELGADIKNKISHRADALRQFIDWLKSMSA